ncbi:MAG TPA: hypothetical protein VF794_03360 [Archangium sp.]|uniref:hypothetical protein n=1 Tax=Archangium sp. TaxID=1872627 RepID=UPI002EDA2789
MTKKLVGLFASVALLGSGMALAQDTNTDQQTQGSGQLGGDATGGSGSQGQVGGSGSGSGSQVGGSGSGSQVGGSGSGSQVGGSQAGGSSAQMGGASAQMGEKQVSGTVVKSSSTLVHVQTDQGVIPLKVGRDTKFEDPSVKRARDLKEGQQIRASFDIKGTDNVAKSISLDASMGGSGLDSDTGINQQPGDVGGSGMGDDINKGNMGGSGGDLGGSGDVGGSGDLGGSGKKGEKSY